MANPKPYYTKLLKKTLNNVNGSFGSCDFNIAIVVVKSDTRDPRRQTRADRRSAKEVLARIQEIVCEYCSRFLAAISSASRLWYLMHSFLIPPVVVNTSGVNEPCSTSNTSLSTTASCRFHGCDRSAVAPGPCKTRH